MYRPQSMGLKQDPVLKPGMYDFPGIGIKNKNTRLLVFKIKNLFFVPNTIVSMNNKLRKVVVLLAHPNFPESKANKMLIDTVKDIEGVYVYNLYEQELPFNVEEWIRVASDASALVYQFPLYWLSAPSLLKKWQDEVFTFLSQSPAIAGKPLLVVTTTGSEWEAYRSGGRNHFTLDEILRPFQVGALVSGMLWQTPLVLYGAGKEEAPKNSVEVANFYKETIGRLLHSAHVSNNW